MYKVAITLMFLLYSIITTPIKAEENKNSYVKYRGLNVKGVLTNVNLDEKILEVEYQLRNDLDQDIWICESISRYLAFERYLADDGLTLIVRKRLSVPMMVRREQPIGRYLRLRRGESHIESFVIPLPVNIHTVFVDKRRNPNLIYATRLVIEIGYYVGDLPGMIFSLLENAENIDNVFYKRSTYKSKRSVREWLKGSLTFNEINESSKDREEQVIIPWMNQALKSEQICSIVAENLKIPYKGIRNWPEHPPVYLATCTKLEIQYQPSMLEYFFPFEGQQRLLNLSEKRSIQSLRTIVVDDPEHIRNLAYNIIKESGSANGIVRQRSSAYVTCYRGKDLLTSFVIYDCALVEIKEKQQFIYPNRLQQLSLITPQIKPLELRVQCSNNLKNLWYRLHFFNKAEKVRLKESFGGSNKIYPSPGQWCDSMESTYESIGMLKNWIMKPYKCPSVIEGKSHYAMNPNCKPDSPPNIVLLFETKAGWNQHGGPELFTFDNHEPKGGCVLLNDGTVKFIRTKEELQQLRWK